MKNDVYLKKNIKATVTLLTNTQRLSRNKKKNPSNITYISLMK